MGILSQSTATVRHLMLGSPSTPSLSKKLLIRVGGLVAIVSVVGASSAAQTSNVSQAQPSPEPSKSSSIDITHATNNSPASAAANVDSNTTSISSSVKANSSQKANSSVQATVNGQSIDIPTNGNSQQTITTPDGTTSVTVSNQTSSQGSNNGYNSTHTSINSSTYSNDSNVTMEQQNEYH